MVTEQKLSKYCIYTMRKREGLQFHFSTGGAGKFTENKNWKTGYSLFQDAKKDRFKDFEKS